MLIRDTFDQVEKRETFVIVFAEEFLGHALYIESVLEALRDTHNRNVASLVKLAYIKDHRTKLAEKEIAGLTLNVQMLAGSKLTVFTLDPVPKTLRPLAVNENEKVFVMKLRYFFMNCCKRLGPWDLAVG